MLYRAYTYRYHGSLLYDTNTFGPFIKLITVVILTQLGINALTNIQLQVVSLARVNATTIF